MNRSRMDAGGIPNSHPTDVPQCLSSSLTVPTCVGTCRVVQHEGDGYGTDGGKDQGASGARRPQELSDGVIIFLLLR